MKLRYAGRAAAVAGVILLLASCGQSKSTARCVDASSATGILATQLQSDMAFTGRVAAVKSSEFKQVYMVAAEFSGPGVDNEVGVWAMNDLTGPSTVFAVDAMARSFSDWPAADTSMVRADITTDGASEAKDCVSG